MKTSKTQIQCPNCKSFKVTSGRLLVFIIGLTSVGCFGSVFMIIFFPIGILAILGGLFMMVASPFVKKGYYCQNCHLQFKSEPTK